MEGPELDRPTGAEAPPTVRGAVTRFALGGLAAVLLLGAIGYWQISRVGRDQAIEDAERVAGVIGRGIVEPSLPANPERHPARARVRLDDLLAGVVTDPIVRIKIWSADGTIVYSDESRLIGSTYGLGGEESDALRTGGVEAELSDLSKPENRFERDRGELLEVYFPITDPDGDRLLFESYSLYDDVISSGRDLRLELVPALIGALALLAIIQIPLAVRMVRRIRDDYARREALLQRAADASDRERRRIAADLHDGVVQRMAGTTYTLDALATDERPDPERSREALRKAAATTRESIRELRTTLIEIYPPGLEQAGGLERALDDLLGRLEPAGIATTTSFADDAPLDDLPIETQQLLFRVAQEALRNAQRHGRPENVAVTSRRVGPDTVELEISEDGRGFDPSAAGAEGHFGLALIRDLARDGGGEVEIESAPGQGTLVRVRVDG